MRIITGKARGLKLTVPKNMDVRPTADRVKESLFNIIGTKIIGARVLDIWGWSRGAAALLRLLLSMKAGNRCVWYKATSLNAGRRLMFRFSKAAR